MPPPTSPSPGAPGRDLSLVVWATTIGSVAGPNLVGPGGSLARALGLPELTGPFVFSVAGFLLAWLLLWGRLRPDPLLLARQLADESRGSVTGVRPSGSVLRGLRTIAARPSALLGLITLSLGHAVMVSVMVMTPLHMHHGGAELRVVGLVLSIHIFGMFAFSPLVGMAVDRYGGRPVAIAGAVILVVAGLTSAQSPEGWSGLITVALFALGVGWSFTMISGSTLIAGALPVDERAGAQGASDMAMGLAAGGGGALAGIVVGQLGYDALSLGAAALAGVILVCAVFLGRASDPAS